MNNPDAALEEMDCAVKEVKAIGDSSFEVLELRNLALTAEIVMWAALARYETRGMHHRNDFPQEKEGLARVHVSVQYGSYDARGITTMPCRG